MGEPVAVQHQYVTAWKEGALPGAVRQKWLKEGAIDMAAPNDYQVLAGSQWGATAYVVLAKDASERPYSSRESRQHFPWSQLVSASSSWIALRCKPFLTP